VYLVYLIVIVSTGKAALPIVSLAMIGAVYGLQAIIFLLKREFMLIGWMIIYILASVLGYLRRNSAHRTII
jgi:chitin synthase